MAPDEIRVRAWKLCTTMGAIDVQDTLTLALEANRLRLPEQFIQHAVEKIIVDPNVESKILQHVHEVDDLYEMARQGKT